MCHPHFVMRPSFDQWYELWKICDDIDIWSWPESLGDSDYKHPERWFTQLGIDARFVTVRGCLEGTPKDIRAKLMRFHQAMQTFVGWHEGVDVTKFKEYLPDP